MNGGHLLRYDEAFSEEKNLYVKTKVGIFLSILNTFSFLKNQLLVCKIFFCAGFPLWKKWTSQCNFFICCCFYQWIRVIGLVHDNFVVVGVHVGVVSLCGFVNGVQIVFAIGVVGSYGGRAHHVDVSNVIVVHAISIDQEHSKISISKIKRCVVNIDENFWNNMLRMNFWSTRKDWT